MLKQLYSVLMDGVIITSSADGTVRIWNIPDYQELIDEMLLKINGIKFSPNDRRVYYLE